MGDEEGEAIRRSFEGNDQAVSFYCDFVQLVGTTDELILQFYETIPDPPDESGGVSHVTSRLRASVTVSEAHARRLVERLAKNLSEPESGGESSGGTMRLEQP